jgi:carbon monoxide dehydrogenase subunit G
MDGPVAKGIAAMRLFRTMVVEKPLDTVFDFLSDFTTTVQWDPGTVTTVRLHGNGGIGTTYLNTTKFLGKETQLTYVVEELADRKLIRLRGENETVTSVDTMRVRRVGSGTEVSYRAEFEFKGLSRLIAPLLKPALERLGNQAQAGMRKALNRLEVE